MKGKNTLVDRPFRYGGITREYSKTTEQLMIGETHCYCCNGKMKSNALQKSYPYLGTFRITKGPQADNFHFKALCRFCAYRYGKGVIEMDGNTYLKESEFDEDKYKKEIDYKPWWEEVDEREKDRTSEDTGKD